MMNRTTIPTILLLTLGLVLPVQAKPGRVDRVIFEGRSKTLDFTVTATKELDASKAEALPDRSGYVLILRIGGVTAKRRWVKAKDAELKRVLLHSSKERPPGAVIRVRFKKKVVDRALMKRISVFVEDEGIRISIPRPSVPADMDANKKAGTQVIVADSPTTPDPPSPNAQNPTPTTPTTLQPPTQPRPAPSTTPTSARPDDTLVFGGNAPANPPVPPVPPAAPTPAAPLEPMTAEPPPPPVEPLQAPRPASESPDASGLVFMPGVRTQDILAGFTDMSLRLETGMKSRPGIHRIAVLPFLNLDDDARDQFVGDVSHAVMTNRLTKRTGIVQTDPDLLLRTVAPLQRDDLGRYDLNEARAAGVSVGADTLIVGTVSTNGNGYTIDTRAIDVQSGKRLGVVSQEFEADAFHDYRNQIRLEKTYKGTLARSAVLPGWGQFYQGETGRGAIYLTIFSAALMAGLTSALLGSSAASTYQSSENFDDVALRDEANKRYGQANIFYLGSGMVWLTAMIDSAFTGRNKVVLDPELYGATP